MSACRNFMFPVPRATKLGGRPPETNNENKIERHIAHLYVVEAKKERAVGLPKPTLATVFEVVTAGKVYRVTGAALQRWIVEKRSSWNGPKGMLFRERPGLE